MLLFRCPLVHAARNGHLNVVAYLLACDWVLDNPGPNQEVSLAEAAQQALIASSAQGHLEVMKSLINLVRVYCKVNFAIFLNVFFFICKTKSGDSFLPVYQRSLLIYQF